MGEEREQGAEAEASASETGPVTHAGSTRREPTVLTWHDLADLPEQILPPETYKHLRNAGREALLALYSLWRAAESSSHNSDVKARRRIDVE